MKKTTSNLILAVIGLCITSAAWATKPGKGNPNPPPFEGGGTPVVTSPSENTNSNTSASKSDATSNALAGALAGAASGSVSNSVSKGGDGGNAFASGGQGGKSTATGGTSAVDASLSNKSHTGDVSIADTSVSEESHKTFVAPAPSIAVIPQAYGCIVSTNTAGGIGWNFAHGARADQKSDPVCAGLKLAAEIGYPLVVRPSYVLGGRAMEIVHEQADLERYMREAVKVSNDSPVLLDRFLNDAIEVDVDAISDGEQVIIGGIMQHIEQAGVHSGDSACSLPPYSLGAEVQDEIRRQTIAMAKALNVVGLMNVQFAIQGDTIYVLEVNPRASRTVPFVSKVTGQPLAKIAARCMAGITLAAQGVTREVIPPYFAVKEAVFPFIKFPGVDTILGPEMKSTGEVMGVGGSFAEAYVKSQLAAGDRFPKQGKVFLSVRQSDKNGIVEVARDLLDLGFELVATRGTAQMISEQGLPVTAINKVTEGRPHVVDMIKNGEICLVINTVDEKRQAVQDSYSIRRSALQGRIPQYTTLAGARAVCIGMRHLQDLGVYSVQSLHSQL